jgi:NADH:ubiquinone oxidoreductase subunit
MQNETATGVLGVIHKGSSGATNWTCAPIPPILPPDFHRAGPGVLRDLRANNFYTVLRTWLRGELVGVDEYGNRYYRERGRGVSAWRKERRWVVFSRDADPTGVPTGWVGWLHGRIDKPPSEQPLPAPSWAKERLPNLTGTPAAYLPPGAIERGGQRAPATGDYEAWRPE